MCQRYIKRLLIGTLLFILVACTPQTADDPPQSTTVPMLQFIPTATPSPVATLVPPFSTFAPLQPTPENSLFQDPNLSQQPVTTSLYSDLNGFGAYLFWRYQGASPIGPVDTYWGTLPQLEQLLSESYPSVESGKSDGHIGGVLLPGGFFIPGESRPGDQVQLGLKVSTPTGKYGAMLVFTLAQGADGFEPVGISIQPLP